MSSIINSDVAERAFWFDKISFAFFGMCRISPAQRGRYIPTPEEYELARKLFSISMLGKSVTDETKAKMSKAALGRKHSDETIEKMTGRKHSIEELANMSKAAKDKPKSAEHKANMSKPKSAEARANMSKAKSHKYLMKIEQNELLLKKIKVEVENLS
jgi:hypothetical protein